MRTLITLLLAGLLTSCSSGGADNPAATTTTQLTYSISGTFTLVGVEGDQYVAAGGTCAGYGGYDDIEEGLQVTVTDEAGTVIGADYLLAGGESDEGCTLPFKVDDIRPAKFYKVAVGRRGEISYSQAEMEARDWFVELTLGD